VRPSFEEILGYEEVAAELELKMIVAVARCKSTLVSMDILMDIAGMIAVFTFSSQVPSGPAKLTVDTIIQAFPQQQREALIRTFRPLDELDRFRFDAMQTVRSLRPCVPKEKEEPEEFFCIPGETNNDPKFKSVEAYCLALEEEERIEKESLAEEVWQNTLAVTDNASVSGSTLAVQRAKVEWVELAQNYATISILSIGSCKLTYIRCHREARRVLLLERGLDSSCSLCGSVKVAMQHSDAGALPHPSQSRLIKMEFTRGCIAVLKSKNPSAESDVKKLSFKDPGGIIGGMGGGVCLVAMIVQSRRVSILLGTILRFVGRGKHSLLARQSSDSQRPRPSVRNATEAILGVAPSVVAETHSTHFVALASSQTRLILTANIRTIALACGIGSAVFSRR